METTVKPTRSQRSESEIKEILKDHEESDMSVKDFCELYSISEQTFYNWRNKYSPKVTGESGQFVAMELAASTSGGVFAEIEVPGKIFRLYHPISPEFLKALL